MTTGQTVYPPAAVRFDVLDTPLHRLVAIHRVEFAVEQRLACMNELTLLLEDELAGHGATHVHYWCPAPGEESESYELGHTIA